jgi:hypothetical protein
VIRNNLSTRPFYNERAVRLLLLVAAAVVIAATLFNVSRVLSYSRSDTALASRAAEDEDRAEALRANAAKLRASVDMKALQVAASEARQANELIDKRTFSWTALLNLFEATLPPDVRITTVQPSVNDQGQIVLTVNVLAQGVEEIERFMQNLEGTGAVRNPFVRTDQVTEQDQVSAALTAEYLPTANPAANAPASNPAERREGAQ